MRSGKEMKKIIIPGTLSESYVIDKLREAVKAGKDPAVEVAKKQMAMRSSEE